ncbi:lipid-A-disaccharide synthase [Pectinatus sottacetonis]|uniref:lipid-A-disaccharide synthase n=1 Tax=Pectinatus sottacetonis TaxID=1002795 RepID=UPI0018C711E9|nr:lipid-A-disaccharide synthase [Pectinatus sottacetonis]
MHKIMFSAGEVSGDMHGANLAEALKKIEPDIKLVGFGGNKMEKAGVRLIANMAQYSVMGFYEVLVNLRKMIKLRDKLGRFMEKERPDILVLIDYPDFNWRLAPIAKKLNIPVFSYIPPSAWAWRRSRAKKVAVLADKIASIFPFEIDVYKENGADIEFVGNPLIETVKPSLKPENINEYFSLDNGENNILLLPGSRKQEIKAIFPVMLQAAELFQKRHPLTKFHLVIAQGIEEEQLKKIASRYTLNIAYHKDHLYDLMYGCDMAFATSGTVVLEAGLMELPTIVLYRMSFLTYCIAKVAVNIKYFSLPNILAQKQVMPELLQYKVTPANIVIHAEKILQNGGENIKKELRKIKMNLGRPGVSRRVAELIIKTADKNKLMNGNKT